MISIVALLCSFSALGLVGALVALTCLLVGVLQKRTRLGLIGLVIAGVALIISIVALSIQAANGS